MPADRSFGADRQNKGAAKSAAPFLFLKLSAKSPHRLWAGCLIIGAVATRIGADCALLVGRNHGAGSSAGQTTDQTPVAIAAKRGRRQKTSRRTTCGTGDSSLL